ncbi:hypothetical protein BDZ97DRAFT_1827354 [Flammula alnicola]|nr:hypothetical protein BDZ97DRAFT_1827354 [Flammula alnicola]
MLEPPVCYYPILAQPPLTSAAASSSSSVAFLVCDADLVLLFSFWCLRRLQHHRVTQYISSSRLVIVVYDPVLFTWYLSPAVFVVYGPRYSLVEEGGYGLGPEVNMSLQKAIKCCSRERVWLATSIRLNH